MPIFDFYDAWEDACPRCRIGTLQVAERPFVRLFHGCLFVIPDARCYICDLCHYHEFDEDVLALARELLFHPVTAPDADMGHIRPILPLPDDDAQHTDSPSSGDASVNDLPPL